MTTTQRLGLGLAPLFLRLVLGSVFLWAGSAKLFVSDVYPPEQAAALANLGIIKPADSQSQPPAPEEEIPAETAPDEDVQIENPAVPEGTTTSAAAGSSGTIILVQNESPSELKYTAADFPEGAKARRLYGLALLFDVRANPTDGTSPLWPQALASGTMIHVMPWAAAVAEFAGGVFVLFGLLTRLAALGLTGTMLAAMLLTTIGPAAVSGTGFLGFLPDPQFADANAWGPAWQPMMFQLTTGVIAFALVLTGAGWLSFDQRLAGRKPDKDGGDS